MYQADEALWSDKRWGSIALARMDFPLRMRSYFREVVFAFLVTDIEYYSA